MNIQSFVQETQRQLNSIERRLQAAGGGGGEVNTASNLGAGIGVYDQKVGVDLQFRSFVAASAMITIALDAVNHEIDFDIDPSQIDLDDLGDVVAPAPGANEVLTWNGANWVNQAPAGGAPTNAEYVVLALDAALTDERVLTAGTNIDIADGGAGGNVTIKVDDAGWTTNAIVRTEGTTDLVADSAVFSLVLLTGYVGINEADPLTFLHIVYNDTGGARVSSSVILLIEHNYDCYMQILCDLYDEAGIYFGHHDDPDEARIWNDTNWKEFRIQTDTAYFGKIDQNQNFGIGVPTGTFCDCKLHVYEGNAGAAAHADAVACFENNGDVAIQLLSGSQSIGAIYFGDSTNDDGQLGYDQSSQYMWMAADQTEIVRINSTGVSIGDAPIDTNVELWVIDQDGNPTVIYSAHNATAGWASAVQQFRRSRGNYGTPAAVVNNDRIGDFKFYAYDGSGYIVGAEIIVAMDAAPTDIGNIVPMRMSFYTMDTLGALNEAMRIDDAQHVGIGMTPTANGVFCIALPTENLEIIDAGSVGATQQDWIEVEIGGVQGYVHVYAAK